MALPKEFPVYLWQPFLRHSYFCFQEAAEQKKFSALLTDCIRHLNHGKSQLPSGPQRGCLCTVGLASHLLEWFPERATDGASPRKERETKQSEAYAQGGRSPCWLLSQGRETSEKQDRERGSDGTCRQSAILFMHIILGIMPPSLSWLFKKI